MGQVIDTGGTSAIGLPPRCAVASARAKARPRSRTSDPSRGRMNTKLYRLRVPAPDGFVSVARPEPACPRTVRWGRRTRQGSWFDNLDDTLSRLRSEGVKVLTAPRTAGGMRSAFVQAPDGMELEIVEGRATR